MGTGTSSFAQLSTNESLTRFVSLEPISVSHPFWNGFLSYQIHHPKTPESLKKFEENVESLCKRFIDNNLKTGNFGTLLELFLIKQAEVKSSFETNSSVFIWQTTNNLFVLRCCFKFFIERLKNEDELHAQIEAVASKPNESPPNDVPSHSSPTKRPRRPEDRLEYFIRALISIITELPLTSTTYALHTESTISLLTLLSSTLFSSRPAITFAAYKILMSSNEAPKLTKTLLTRFVDQQEESTLSGDEDKGGSLVVGLASGMWNILTMGYSTVVSTPSEIKSATPLADYSILLLLVLTNQCMDLTNFANTTLKENPFRKSLFRLTNAQGDTSSEDPESRFDFSRLFKTIWSTLSTDESTLLLYLLLHQNESFRIYVLASSDMDLLVVPILQTLYRAPSKTTNHHHINHHIYMSLIILLILSEDDLFNSSVHETVLKNVEWYSERTLNEISLGGLLILVVIRTIQYNMLKMRDKYLHTNCLAALANMSSQFRHLHPYVSQRIISMFEALAKKHYRIISTVQHSGEIEGLEDDSLISDILADAEVLEEVLRMILEIMNSCLVHQIKNNPNLIYTMLYKRDLFSPYSSHPSFQDLTQNLQTVISYFSSKLEQNQEKKERVLAVSEVQDIIRQTAIQFPKEKLMKFPDLKFKYVEEEKPEDFFIPYIWTLVTSKIYWNPDSISLLPHKE